MNLLLPPLLNDEETITVSYFIYGFMGSLNDGQSFEPLQKYVKNNVQSDSLKIVLDAYISACYQFFSQVCI